MEGQGMIYTKPAFNTTCIDKDSLIMYKVPNCPPGGHTKIGPSAINEGFLHQEVCYKEGGISTRTMCERDKMITYWYHDENCEYLWENRLIELTL